MAYIVVTTDEGTVVFKKRHSEYLAEKGHGSAKLLNDLTSAVLKAETFDCRIRAKHIATYIAIRDKAEDGQRPPLKHPPLDIYPFIPEDIPLIEE